MIALRFLCQKILDFVDFVIIVIKPATTQNLTGKWDYWLI